MRKQPLLLLLVLAILTACTRNQSDPIEPEPPLPPVPQGPSGSLTWFDESPTIYSHLTTIKYDGTEQKTLLKDTFPDINKLHQNLGPEWSFDRSKIIFASDRASLGSMDLFVINSDGTGLKQVTNTPNYSEYFASFSPDGQTILYTAKGDNGMAQLFLCNADGSNPRQISRLTHPSRPVKCDQALWSYDGKTIYFMANKDTTFHNIYSMKPDGSDVKRLTTNDKGHDFLTSVSRNGKLAFWSSVNGVPVVFTVNADGTNRTQLTNFWSGDPALSPDGSYIAFISTKDKASRSEGEDIYTMKLDGTELKRLTNSTTQKFYPDWK